MFDGPHGPPFVGQAYHCQTALQRLGADLFSPTTEHLLFSRIQTRLPSSPTRVSFKAAMKEIIYVQAGNISNHIGTHFWNAQQSYFTYGEGEDVLVDHDVSFREGVSPRVSHSLDIPLRVSRFRCCNRENRHTAHDCYNLIERVIFSDSLSTTMRPINFVSEFRFLDQCHRPIRGRLGGQTSPFITLVSRYWRLNGVFD